MTMKPLSPVRARLLTLMLVAPLALGGCGGMPDNPTLNSVHQPVVSHDSFSLDVATGPEGLAQPEQKRLADWFKAMGLRYGDKIALEDPLTSDATRADVAAIAARFGMLVNADTPVATGYVNAGTAHIVITRAVATVPGCPDWHAGSDANYSNGTSTNFGCAVNSNLAAMVADPDELLHGTANTDSASAAKSTKAINAYVYSRPTGTDGVKPESTKSGN